MSELDRVYQEATTKRDEFESKLILKAWENEDFRRHFLASPRKVLEQEIGLKIPENIEIHTLEETGNKIYFVIPQKPVLPTADGTLTDEALQQVAGGALNFCFSGGSVTYTDEGKEIYNPIKLLFWTS